MPARLRAEGGSAGGSAEPVDPQVQLRRLYGRLASEFGWTYPEIDAMSIHDANEIVETLNEIRDQLRDGVRTRPAEDSSPPMEIERVEHRPTGILTEEHFARIEAANRAFAAQDKPRSPWA